MFTGGNIIRGANVNQTLGATLPDTFHLHRTGTGILTLTGSNDNIPAEIIIDAGSTIKLGPTGTLGYFDGGYELGHTITCNGTFHYNSSTTQDFSCDFIGTGNVIVDGDLFVTGNCTYTGGTEFRSGIGHAGSASAFGPSGNLTFTGGTLQFSPSNHVDFSNRIKNSFGTINIDTNAEDITFASVLDSSNTGGMDKIGLGTLTLGGSNTYTGTTYVSDGILSLTNSNALSSGNITFAGGTLQHTATNTVDYSTRIHNSISPIHIKYNGVMAYNGIIDSSNIGGFILDNLGASFTLGGANTFTGDIYILAGTLQLGNASTTANISSGVNYIDLSNGAFFNVSRTNAITISSIITGTLTSGGVRNISTGDLTLSGNNTLTGGPNTYRITGSGNLILSGTNTALTYAVDAAAVGSSHGLVIENTNAVPSGATISITGSGSFVNGLYIKNGVTAGTGVSVLGNNTSGRTGIAIGNGATWNGSFASTTGSNISQINMGNNAVMNGNITCLSGQILAFRSDFGNNASCTVTNTSGSGSKRIINGIISGTLGGGQISSNSNVWYQFNGINTVSGGSLTIQSVWEVAGAGRIAVTPYSGNISLNGASTGYIHSSSADQLFSGVISSGGYIIQNGSGTLTFTGANTYTGTTTINGGILDIGNGGTTGSLGTGAVDISSGATLRFDRSNAHTVNNNISGAGNILDNSVGTTTFAGSLTLTGSITVTIGIMHFNNMPASTNLICHVSNSSPTTANSGRFEFNAAADLGGKTFNVVVTETGTFSYTWMANGLVTLGSPSFQINGVGVTSGVANGNGTTLTYNALSGQGTISR